MCLFIESIKIKDGQCFNLPLHQQRMNRSRKALCGSRGDISLINIIQVPEQYRYGLVKCRVVYGEAVQKIEFVPYTFPLIHTLQCVREDDIEYAYKYADRSAILSAFGRRGASDDVLILQDNYLTDTSFCNVVLKKGDNYFTPETCLLHGVKRQQLLQEGKITESRISLDDLHAYDSLHLINAMIDIEDSVSMAITSIAKPA